MVQKYQNEIAPIFYYGISTKTNEKDLKIPNLQPPDWKSPYWMTLYYGIDSIVTMLNINSCNNNIDSWNCLPHSANFVEETVSLKRKKL